MKNISFSDEFKKILQSSSEFYKKSESFKKQENNGNKILSNIQNNSKNNFQTKSQNIEVKSNIVQKHVDDFFDYSKGNSTRSHQDQEKKEGLDKKNSFRITKKYKETISENPNSSNENNYNKQNFSIGNQIINSNNNPPVKRKNNWMINNYDSQYPDTYGGYKSNYQGHQGYNNNYYSNNNQSYETSYYTNGGLNNSYYYNNSGANKRYQNRNKY